MVGWFLRKRDLAIISELISWFWVHSGLTLPPKPHSDRNLIHTPIIIIRVVKTHLDGQSNGTVGGIYKWRYAGFEKYLRLLHGCFSSILLLQWVLLTDFFSFLFLHKHVWKVGRYLCMIYLGSIHIWRQMFFWHFWPTYLPKSDTLLH